jgi:hypothetical protein
MCAAARQPAEVVEDERDDVVDGRPVGHVALRERPTRDRLDHVPHGRDDRLELRRVARCLPPVDQLTKPVDGTAIARGLRLRIFAHVAPPGRCRETTTFACESLPSLLARLVAPPKGRQFLFLRKPGPLDGA